MSCDEHSECTKCVFNKMKTSCMNISELVYLIKDKIMDDEYKQLLDNCKVIYDSTQYIENEFDNKSIDTDSDSGSDSEFNTEDEAESESEEEAVRYFVEHKHYSDYIDLQLEECICESLVDGEPSKLDDILFRCISVNHFPKCKYIKLFKIDFPHVLDVYEFLNGEIVEIKESLYISHPFFEDILSSNEENNEAYIKVLNKVKYVIELYKSIDEFYKNKRIGFVSLILFYAIVNYCMYNFEIVEKNDEIFYFVYETLIDLKYQMKQENKHDHSFNQTSISCDICFINKQISKVSDLYDIDECESEPSFLKRVNRWLTILQNTNFNIMNKHVIDLNCMFN